jgi:hypothetical protein
MPLLLAVGCTTMGTGSGSTAAGNDAVHFTWKSFDGVTGTMVVTLSDGSLYAGSYFQIIDNTTIDSLGPLWDGWGPGLGFGRWHYWDTGSEFVTHYSGRVVVNLADPRASTFDASFNLYARRTAWQAAVSATVSCRMARQLTRPFPAFRETESRQSERHGRSAAANAI